MYTPSKTYDDTCPCESFVDATVGGLEGDRKGRVMDEITCVKETDIHLGIEDTRVRNTNDG